MLGSIIQLGFLWASDININALLGTLSTCTASKSDAIWNFQLITYVEFYNTLDLQLRKFSSLVAEDMNYVNNLFTGCDSEQQLMDYY